MQDVFYFEKIPLDMEGWKQQPRGSVNVISRQSQHGTSGPLGPKLLWATTNTQAQPNLLAAQRGGFSATRGGCSPRSPPLPALLSKAVFLNLSTPVPPQKISNQKPWGFSIANGYSK